MINQTVLHYDKTFDLAKLRGADLFIVYWGSPYIAHTMLSFDFTGGDHVYFSIETRKEKGEEYSAIKGFFKQYELTYIVADERDVVRLRTNYRGHMEPYTPKARFDWRILINDYVDEMAYERGTLDQSLTFLELKRRSYINWDAVSADDDKNFSKDIRQGLPGFK